MTSTASGEVTTGDHTHWLGWCFADYSETLRYGDGRKIEVGTTHKVECEPALCERGLHASPTVYKALGYAPGPILFRVELSGVIVHGDDKSCATERKYLARININELLHEFGRKCALEVIHLWDCPRIVKDYLETGDETLRSAAESAARSAAESAAESAAWSAAWSAASSAAWSAASSAASSAARSAARSAASSAAESAAWSAHEQMLEEIVLAAITAQGPPVAKPQSNEGAIVP